MDSRGPSDGISPVKIDPSVRFSSVGGLKEHIKCLREIIIFPLMYPEIFKKFNTKPAKGILFHGPPGTGKTLLARALANECALVSGKRVSFFFRKGADVADKYYGESERILRTLFHTARKMKPSIIFFDEIDALAPARNHAENFHASVVATLLAEMDGVTDRGDVIVIGATNRPDAMDPAVRRAGRFDRELYFPAPEMDARREILSIFTKDWEPDLNNSDLDHVAKMTVGFLGSDLKSLCSEAVLKAVRRIYPQIYDSDYKLLINAQNVEVTLDDILQAMSIVLPTGARYSAQSARPLPSHTVPLLEDQLRQATELMAQSFPAPSNCCGKTIKTQETGSAPSVFLVSGECAVSLLAPALLAQMEHCLVKELSVSTLHDARAHSPENAIVSLFGECRRSGRDSVIFVRDIQAVWNVLARTNGADVLLQLWNTGSTRNRILILAAANNSYDDDFPSEIKELFPEYKNCVFRMRQPTETEVTNFLQSVIIELPLVPPVVYQYIPPPPLPKAPTGPLESEEDMINRLNREYENLRILRRSLSKISRNLASDHRFRIFKKPADPQTFPDYYKIINNPMDLNLMIRKIESHQYFTAKEYLDDIDLICANAYLYARSKPEKSYRTFLQDASSLHSEAYSMSLDEIPRSVELECQLVARRRRANGEDREPDSGGWNDDFYLSKLDGVKYNKKSPNKSEGSRKRSHCGSNERFPSKRPRLTPKENKKSCVVINDIENKLKYDRIKPRYGKCVEDGIVLNLANISNNTESKSNKSSANDIIKESIAENIAPDQVTISTEQLHNILSENVGLLRLIGLSALIDLHAQITRAVYAYSQISDRTNLPRHLNEIVTRYVEHATK